MSLIPSPSPEGQQPQEQPVNRSLIDHTLAQWEKRRQAALSFDFQSAGYDEGMLADNERFRSSYESLVREAEGDPDRLLGILEAKGIKVIRKSRLLSAQQLMRSLGAGTKSFGAFFAPPHIVEDLCEQYKDASDTMRAELESCRGTAGAIFLDKAPRAKSIFHEAAHAVQQLEGLNMDAKDPVTHAYREIEANTALITLHDQGLIPSITKGTYTTFNAPFGDKGAKVDPNDIYAEALYFGANHKELEEALRARDAQEVEDIRQQLREPPQAS